MKTLLSTVCLAVLGCLLLASTVDAAERSASVKAPAPAKATIAKPKLKPLPKGVVQIQLDDLHCKTCAKKLARKLYAVPGVMRVQSSLKRDLVTIRIQPKKTVAPQRLWEAVIAADLAPLELRFEAQRLTKKHFPKAKVAAKKPTHATKQ